MKAMIYFGSNAATKDNLSERKSPYYGEEISTALMIIC